MRAKPWLIRISLTLIILTALYQGWIYLRVLDLKSSNPVQTAMMSTRLDEMRDEGKPPRLHYRWVPMKRISPYLQRALIVSEDATFYGHEGFDWEGIKYAAEKNLKKGKVIAGGSTISQQLAKNLFLSTQRTPWRKGQEALITIMLEKTLSKRRIFEIYLNVIEWGNGIFGAEAASRHYFGKSAASLTPAEAARLAAMVPAPRYYDQHRQTRRLERKISLILKRMSKRYGSNYNAAPQLITPPVQMIETPMTLEPELTVEPTADTPPIQDDKAGSTETPSSAEDKQEPENPPSANETPNNPAI